MENLQTELTFYSERILTGLILFILFLMLLPTIIKILKPFFITLLIKLFKIDVSEIEMESDSIENLIEKTGFEWFSSSWDITNVGEQKGLKISVCYLVSI